MFDGSGSLGLGKCIESRLQYRSLRGCVVDVSIGPTERMLDRGNSRHADDVLILPDHVQGNGRNTGCFDNARNQSHGPAAIRSDRCEEEEVHLLVAQCLGDRRSAFVFELARVVALKTHD
jgi:hypothetical protein